MTTEIFAYYKNLSKKKLIISIPDSTIFGCHYSNNFLYLACYNRNKIIFLDLKKGTIQNEITVPSPNDVCCDDTFLYVASGTNFLFFNLPTEGNIIRIRIKDYQTETFMSNLTTLSGICCDSKNIYVSRLYDFIKINKKTKKIKTISKCQDNGKNYLSDNITMINDKIYVSLYREMNNENILYLQKLQSIFYIGGIFITQLVNFINNEEFNLSNPEQLLSFSKKDKMPNIKYMCYDIAKNDVSFYDLKSPANADGHFTQFAEYMNFYIGVNFMYPSKLFVLKKNK
jgi:hypothetical protein